MSLELVRVARFQLQAGIVAGADPDEYARRRSTQSIRSFGRVLQGLPGDLQQQPLLGIHAGHLAGGDPKEPRVESVYVLQEGAPSRGHLSGGIGVGIEEGVDIPTHSGNLGDGVHPLMQESPEGFRIHGAAREPAAQADYGNGLARLRPLLLGPRLQRVQAEVLKSLPGAQALLGLDPQHARHLLPHVSKNEARPAAGGLGLDLGQDLGRRDGSRPFARPPPIHQFPEQRRRAPRGKGSQELRPIDAERRDLGHRGRGQQFFEGGHPLFRCDEADPRRRPAPPVVVFHSGRHSRPRPRPPVHAQGGKAQGPPMVSQAVQEGVGGRVVSLPDRAQQRRRGRKHDEEIEGDRGRLTMQVPRPQDLRRQHRCEPPPVLLLQDPVPQNPRRVDHAPQRWHLPEAAQERRDVLLPRHVRLY